MGALKTCGRILVVSVNIFFLFIGVVLFGAGMFLRFGKKYTDDYVQSAEEALKKALEDTGIGNSTDVDLDMNELLLTLSIVLICIGLFFGIISLLGVLGACCQIKCLLVMYVVICLAIAIAEVVCVILLYTDDTFADKIKTKLKDNIKTDYRGLGASDISSVSWNILMIKYGCCGVDAYTDFDNTEKWAHTETTNGVTKTVATPVSCCKTLPSSEDLSCAQIPLLATENYLSEGCYQKAWEDTLGNAIYAAAILAGIGLLQILLIIGAIIVLCSGGKDGKAKERPSSGKVLRKNQVAPGSIPGFRAGRRRY
ncbi:tetraspanin-1-like [Mya arenaria]|uniref:tetraspanin-1-like n=1 Tax=Mya arenaria TaxID=6604 RepID=UPI0022E073AE|nr:tetraspanin-1-like [Mya arenaria]